MEIVFLVSFDIALSDIQSEIFLQRTQLFEQFWRIGRTKKQICGQTDRITYNYLHVLKHMIGTFSIIFSCFCKKLYFSDDTNV